MAVIVDLNTTQGTPDYTASGFLHGMSDTTPVDGLVLPLNPKMFRSNETEANVLYPRATTMGASVQIVLSDSWGYSAPWPGDGGDWNSWLTVVGDIVSAALAAGRTFHWDIWGEPDMGASWGASAAQYAEMWRRTHIHIRSLDATAVIVGPSYSAVNGIGDFLLFARDNSVLPTIISWHEFLPGVIETHVAEVEAALVTLGVSITRFSINEFIGPTENFAPGALVGYLAELDRSTVESAAHACWPDDGVSNCSNNSMDGILTVGTYLTRPQWWIYKGYAAITGTRVGVTLEATIDALAGKDAGIGEVHIVLGRHDPGSGTLISIDLQITNIASGAPYLTGSSGIQVVARRIPDTGFSALVSPTEIINARYVIAGDAITITLVNCAAEDAFLITLSLTPQPASSKGKKCEWF